MSSQLWTPGPWRYRPHKHDDWGTVRAPVAIDAIGTIICQARDPLVYRLEQLGEHRLNKTDPWEANARLIAAAPDLYEALEHILAGALSLPRFAEEQARAALSKANPPNNDEQIGER